MSWKNAVSYAKDIAGKHGFGGGVEQDEDLPLGARIGGFLRLQKSPFIRAVSCLLYTSPSPRDRQKSRMPSSA